MKTILIQTVSNGYIVTEKAENLIDRGARNMTAEVPVQKVFNTATQLNKYIKENLKIKQNENN